MSRVSELKKKWMKDPEFRQEYEALETEFSIVRMLIDAMQKANLTQEEVAKRMQTRQNVIARLESGKANPSIATLRKYAKATGTKLTMQMSHTE